MNTVRNGTPLRRARSAAATVFPICMRLRIPSCIRAPPDAQNTIAGIRPSTARSSVRATFSPATLPIEPPMKEKSAAATATRRPSSWASPEIIESVASAFSVETASFTPYSGNPKRVARAQRVVPLHEARRVERRLDSEPRGHPPVVSAVGAHPQIRLVVGPEDDLLARRALDEPLRPLRVGFAQGL